ncbi:MAG TPA: PQQ-binding-like beta-propeller repeat protein [Thermomicrobiales bacterium]|nr:PQQ-binding-like beta-propeller repeat protein [Thermomicrobiales bacterium]
MSILNELSRRKFVGTAAAVSAVGFTRGEIALAQDAAEATPIPLPAGPIPEVADYSDDWPVAYQNLLGHRRAPSSTIDSTNVDQLGPAWQVKLTTESGFGPITGTPLVAGDTIYWQDMRSNFYAYDRATGEEKWSKTYDIGSGGPNGVAIGYDMVFGSLGQTCEMVALSMETGDEIWRVRLTNNPEDAIRMAPTVHDGWVYVSVVPQSTRGNWGSRGILHALDAREGYTVWSYDLAADNLWGNARQNMGAGLWYPPTIDENNNIYFGNGNAAPWPGTEEFPSASSRPGENLYANTMMSIDPTTASVRWHVLAKPFDLFDLDYQQAPLLADVEVNGVPTRVAIGSGKSADIIGVNAETGNVLWWTKVGIHQNDELQELPSDRYVEVYPGALGGVETPPAYADGVFYLTLNNHPTYHGATGTGQGERTMEMAWGQVVAIDAATGVILWESDVPTMPLGSIVVANDLVFTGGIDGVVRAFERTTGEEVWNYRLNAGINAPMIIVGDELIVSAGYPVTGTPDRFPDGKPEQKNEMVSFQLGPGGGYKPEAKASAGQATASPAAENPALADPSAATPTVGQHGDLELTVDAVDIGFTQTELSVPANTDVKFTLKNTGVLQHDFVIDDPKVSSGIVDGGESATFTVNFPAGDYVFYCSVPGHREAGMQGTVTVK